MLKKTLTALCVLLFLAQNCLSQNVMQVTQFAFDPLALNPAVAGSDQGIAATLLYRKQWVGLESAPSTALFNFHVPLPNFHAGVGLSLVSDKIGNFSFTRLSPAFSYKLRMGLNTLHVGMAPVFYSSSLSSDWTSLVAKEMDSSIPDVGLKSSAFDANAGVFYKAGKYFAGLSVVNLIGKRIDRLNFQLSRTAMIHGGYQFKLPFSGATDYTAGFNYRTDAGNSAGSQVDLNLIALFKETFWLGANYRKGDSFSPLIGYQKYIPSGKLRIGYAYDYTVSALNAATSGSHEIAVNYVYFVEKPKESERYKNVRFL